MEFGKAVVPGRVSLVCGENVKRTEHEVEIASSKILDGLSLTRVGSLE